MGLYRKLYVRLQASLLEDTTGGERRERQHKSRERDTRMAE